MAKKNILIKPYITEKTELLQEMGQHRKVKTKFNRYTFIVDKKANKIEIKKAVEDMYQVTVLSVNTVVMPARAKSRMTRSGAIRGRVSAYKKAYVTIPDGEEIDVYGEL